MYKEEFKSVKAPIAKARKKIVVIGGGTGIYNVLKGLKRFPYDVTAVVTMFDSGGSSGMLRDEFDVWPPGDVRRALSALADKKYERFLRDLLELRFPHGSSLNGHSLGNILLVGLASAGDGWESVARAEELLRVRGHVLPVSLDRAHLCALLENGTVVRGETHIDIPQHDGALRIVKVFLTPAAAIHEPTRRAIEGADIVVVGPGDLYTSLIPNFLVEGMSEALRKSRATKIYIGNLTTKWGETNGFVASDFVRELSRYAGLQKFDYVLYHKGRIDDSLREAYAREKKYPVPLDTDRLKDFAEHVIVARLAGRTEALRHDPIRVAQCIHNAATLNGRARAILSKVKGGADTGVAARVSRPSERLHGALQYA